MNNKKILRWCFPKKTPFVINKLFQDFTIPFKILEKYTKIYKETLKNDKSNSNSKM